MLMLYGSRLMVFGSRFAPGPLRFGVHGRIYEPSAFLKRLRISEVIKALVDWNFASAWYSQSRRSDDGTVIVTFSAGSFDFGLPIYELYLSNME